MEQFSNILADATLAIAPEYFELPIAGGDDVVRERVYCYELYAQMRRRWPEASRYYLDGEVDKQGHPVLSDLGLGQAKPDFLVHVRRVMDNNYCIMEVKPVGASRRAIRADLEKLCNFIGRAGYQRAVYLIYGDGNFERTMALIRTVFREIADRRAVELWLHSHPGEAATCIDTLEPNPA